MKHYFTWVWLHARRKHVRREQLTQAVSVRQEYRWDGGWTRVNSRRIKL